MEVSYHKAKKPALRHCLIDLRLPAGKGGANLPQGLEFNGLLHIGGTYPGDGVIRPPFD
jgi:hypothetical protein